MLKVWFKVGTILSSYLDKIPDIGMNLCLLLGEQNAIPRCPFLGLIPTAEPKLGEFLVSAEDGLAVPETLHYVADVGILRGQDTLQNQHDIASASQHLSPVAERSVM